MSLAAGSHMVKRNQIQGNLIATCIIFVSKVQCCIISANSSLQNVLWFDCNVENRLIAMTWCKQKLTHSQCRTFLREKSVKRLHSLCVTNTVEGWQLGFGMIGKQGIPNSLARTKGESPGEDVVHAASMFTYSMLYTQSIK